MRVHEIEAVGKSLPVNLEAQHPRAIRDACLLRADVDRRIDRRDLAPRKDLLKAGGFLVRDPWRHGAEDEDQDPGSGPCVAHKTPVVRCSARTGVSGDNADMPKLRNEKILITGPAGQIAFPLAARLAQDNEVWGIARFGDTSTRERVEKAGIQTRVIDLAEPRWGDLPDDFSYVLHLAAAIIPGNDYDKALRINAEGTGKVMERHRNAKACLMMSTCGVYLSPEDGDRALLEGDPLGGSHQPYAPTYCVSKIAQESVARFAAESFGLPTTIARMNAAYGDNGGYPAMLADMIVAGQPIAMFPGHSLCSPIHEDDIFAHTPGLLAAAATPATITNWGGDVPVSVRELSEYIGALLGKDVKCSESGDGIHQYNLDPTRRTALAGPCEVDWKDGVRRMLIARHPELPIHDA